MPSDYIFVENSWGSSFYKVYDREDYSGAKGQCESDGTSLAIPTSQAENEFLMSQTVWELSGHYREDIWIGTNDIQQEGSFVADDDGEISWTGWGTDESNYGVILAWNDNRWYSDDTRSFHKFICLINVECKFFAIE